MKTLNDISSTFQKNESKSDSQLEYVRVLESLMYIMKCTQPDIATVIRKLILFTTTHNQTHWMTMKCVCWGM